MLGELMRIGDEVAVKIPKESREWGYNPCPDGTKGRILRFSEMHHTRIMNFGREPGVYENKSWIEVELPSGKIWINTFHVTCLDELIEKRERVPSQKLRDLPETEFYEDDEVSSPCFSGGSAFVCHIEYDNIGKKRIDGYPMPLYGFKDRIDDGGCLSIGYEGEKSLTLVARGNIWKFFHGEKPTFNSLEEEGRFSAKIGHVSDVMNPKTKLFSYTLKEALETIAAGEGDAMSSGACFFGPEPTLYVIRYKDRDLGRRIAASVLESFKDKLQEETVPA